MDGISIEITKAAVEAGLELLWRVCRAVWKDGIAPMEWRQSIIIPIWKRKGDRRECSEYRVLAYYHNQVKCLQESREDD